MNEFKETAEPGRDPTEEHPEELAEQADQAAGMRTWTASEAGAAPGPCRARRSRASCAGSARSASSIPSWTR